MPEHEPHRPNYAELKQDHADALDRQPDRPDRVRAPAKWAQDPSMPAQEKSAIEQNNENNKAWKLGSKNPAVAQEMQQKLEQERAAQRGNEGPQHDQTDGRKH